MKLNRADKIKAIELSEKHGIEIGLIEKIISSPYEFIQKTTRNLVFEDNLTKEEFSKIKTNFNIPSLGKLFASNYLYDQIQKKKNKS
tara:strand:- start:12227 stop:12487 length:261 start_codon:yes stop_codon:yes gene_type:complete